MNFADKCALAMIATGGMLSLVLASVWPFIGLGVAAILVGVVAGEWRQAGSARETIEHAKDVQAPLEIGTALHQQMEAYLEMDAQPSEKPSEDL
jgi:hypothetical protein